MRTVHGSVPATTPLVSVVLPTYNRLSYLRLALLTVLAQTYDNLEIITQDNASSEDPSALVAAFRDPRMQLYRSPCNVSQTENFLAGIARATGRYIAILADDDLWRPNFISVLWPRWISIPTRWWHFAIMTLSTPKDAVMWPKQRKSPDGWAPSASPGCPSTVRRYRAGLSLDLRRIWCADPPGCHRLAQHPARHTLGRRHVYCLSVGDLRTVLLVRGRAAGAGPLSPEPDRQDHARRPGSGGVGSRLLESLSRRSQDRAPCLPQIVLRARRNRNCPRSFPSTRLGRSSRKA